MAAIPAPLPSATIADENPPASSSPVLDLRACIVFNHVTNSILQLNLPDKKRDPIGIQAGMSTGIMTEKIHSFYLFSEKQYYGFRLDKDELIEGAQIFVSKSVETPGALEYNYMTRDGWKVEKTLTGQASDSLSAEALASINTTGQDITFFTETLHGVKFGTDAKVGNLMWKATDQADMYKYIIDATMTRTSVETTTISTYAISKTLDFGPVSVTISFDPATLSGSVTVKVLGVYIGGGKFGPGQPLTITGSLPFGVASVTFKVWVQSDGVWVELDATVLGKTIAFGPAKI